MARNGASDQFARKRLINKHGNVCQKCRYTGNIELHHIIPVSRGGSNKDDNLILLCEKCHAEIHGRTKKNYLDKNREFYGVDNGG